MIHTKSAVRCATTACTQTHKDELSQPRRPALVGPPKDVGICAQGATVNSLRATRVQGSSQRTVVTGRLLHKHVDLLARRKAGLGQSPAQ
jgi:hypothetical protein